MKRCFVTLLTVAAMMAPSVSNAQENADPAGYVTYSLPSTVIALEVEAVQENFYAGPYAKYAEKSIAEKQRERYELALEKYNTLVYVFPESKYINELKPVIEKVKNELSNIKTK